MPDGPEISRLEGPHGEIAYVARSGVGPGLLWLGGFRSDMDGSKALHLDQWAHQRGRAFTRFDYTGHGRSAGAFADGSIGDWRDDALAIFDQVCAGPQILVGSSMGAWIATLIALARPARVAGAVFIAPAPDFTERLMWPAFSEDQRRAILEKGRLEQPSVYSDAPEIITRRLIEEARAHLVMEAPIAITAPVRILQGLADADVPWRHALAFAECLTSDDVTVTLVKGGDHRLSTPQDLERLTASLETLPG